MILLDTGCFQISVLVTGRGWLAVNKPAGLTVHNTPGRDLCSLVLARIRQDASLLGQVDMEPDFGVHPVHRLDKETSGVLLLAVNRESFRFFAKQFESRRVNKEYVAILHGRLEKPEATGTWGTWDWPLSETAGGRQNPQGPGHRKDCHTRYRVLEYSTHYTMAAIALSTGRTHQIRRHAKLSGHPVAGDARYGSMRAVTTLIQRFAFDRLALHARLLTLMLPGGKTPETIETRTIPGQMQELFQNDLPARLS